MKRVTKVLGVLGGVAALVWAMRDRFISIRAPREPEHPVFRVAPPPSAAPSPSPTDDLTVIAGVGPVYAGRLRAAGISTFAAVAESQPERLAQAAGVPVSRVGSWMDQAGLLRSS